MDYTPLSIFEDPEIFENLKADMILLHIVPEADVNPLDPDTPTNSGRGNYILMEKNENNEDEDNPDYREVFNIRNPDEKKTKMHHNMKKKAESTSREPPVYQSLLHPEGHEKSEEEFENVRYSRPVSMGYENGGHVVYQRIIIKNKKDTTSVYNFIKDTLRKRGVEVSVLDATFEGRNVKYIASVDGTRENLYGGREIKYMNSDMNGEKNASWEVLVDGKFLLQSIDVSKISKGSTLELRRKNGCGGGVSYDEFSTENSPTVKESLLPGYVRSRINASKYRASLGGYHSPVGVKI